MARPSKIQLRLAAATRRAVPTTADDVQGTRPSSIIFDELTARPLTDPLNRPRLADKGKQGRNCNVTACQRPNAWFFNSGTDAYYCFDCAWDIRKFNLRRNSDDGFVLFEQWDEDLVRFETAMKLNTTAREQYVAERLKS